jgi:hypothetical protein
MIAIFAFLLMTLAVIAPMEPDSANRQPSLAVSGGHVAVAFGNKRSLWVSRSGDDGQHFAQPVKVAEVGAVALGRHRGPRIVMHGQQVVVTAITGERIASDPHAHGLPEAGELRAWRSRDGGRTWTGPVVVNDEPRAAREGLHALSIDDEGTIAAVWLDGREKGTTLYGAFSHDGGQTWSKNQRLYGSPDGTICQCCHPSLASLGRNGFQVMFRNAVDGSRDLWTFRWKPLQPASAPVKLGNGTWKLNVCPMDGGGIAVQNGKVLTTWRRDKQIYLDQPGDSEQLLSEGKDAGIAATKRQAIVVWTGSNGQIQSFATTDRQVKELDSAGAFPVIAALGDDGFLAAWEHEGEIRFKLIAPPTRQELSSNR